MTPELGTDFAKLTGYVRDLMHERGEAAADIDRRRDDLPYHALLARYRVAADVGQQTLRRVCNALLPEALGTWEITPLHYLLTLLEEGAMKDAEPLLVSAVYGGSLLRNPDGAQRQMLALRTLLGLGWHGDPLFWRGLVQAIGRQYPALIIRGLAAHGLGQAFDVLPALARDAAAAEQIARLLPALIEHATLPEVKAAFAAVWPRLLPEATALFEDWFARHKYGTLRPAGEMPWQPRLEHLRAAGLASWDQARDQQTWDASAIEQATIIKGLKELITVRSLSPLPA